MLKVVVFDSGYGGELFADRLEEELPVLKVIRVIDWRNANEFLKNAHTARSAAKKALNPYIGRVELIILANHFLSITSLKYFQRKFRHQKFLGLKLPRPSTFLARPTLALTTKSLAHTISYQNYKFRLGRHIDTLCLDHWPGLIDDGELTNNMIRKVMDDFRQNRGYYPQELILACSQFNDIISDFKEILGHNIKIHDSFTDTISDTCKLLKIRGGIGKKKK